MTRSESVKKIIKWMKGAGGEYAAGIAFDKLGRAYKEELIAAAMIGELDLMAKPKVEGL